ncbi:MAG: hypothetical protein CMJ31_09955 [Phycisphaerae bacterium]|nr:hypothetical protein [Phycisphaerae bacterium]
MLLIGVVYAAHMLTPNIGLRFLWPVWLVMTHALGVNAAAHFIGRKRPPISRRAIAFAVASWLGLSVAMIAVMRSRAPEAERDTLAAVWPADVPVVAIGAQVVLAGLFVMIAVRRVRSTGMGARAADKVTRYGALWLCLYACVWLYATGAIKEALVMSGLAVSGFLGMSLLREAYSAMEHPSGYRR